MMLRFVEYESGKVEVRDEHGDCICLFIKEQSKYFAHIQGFRVTSDQYRQIADKLDELNGCVVGGKSEVIAAAREECAALCDKLTYAIDVGGNQYRRPADAEQCAIAIRNLNKDQK